MIHNFFPRRSRSNITFTWLIEIPHLQWHHTPTYPRGILSSSIFSSTGDHADLGVFAAPKGLTELLDLYVSATSNALLMIGGRKLMASFIKGLNRKNLTLTISFIISEKGSWSGVL